MTEALIVRGLSKTFAKPAVSDLDLTVHAGELYALLGPNGAGKTTTLRMVAGLTQPDTGEVSIFGVDARKDPAAAKALLAWAPDEAMIYDKLTPLEYLEFVAGLWNIDPTAAKARAEELLATLGLTAEARRRCEGVSRGMKQKVALAGALIHDPKLLILDEPLTGLDAATARDLVGTLRAVSRGRTTLLIAHDAVSLTLADRVVMVEGGTFLPVPSPRQEQLA